LNKTRAILVTGLLAGVLDGAAAVGLYMYRGGRAPARIFNFIASGVFGPAAMTGGTPMVIAGVGFHLLIAVGWTALYFLAARQFEVLRRHFIGAAAVYGVFVWIMMNKVVLPLSRVQMGPAPTWNSIAIGALVLVVCIGFPVSLGARWYFSQPAAR
jgi:uncharacterized membrane protein YagU involved in acid resistance